MTKREALQILGLTENYTPEELKKSYRKLSKKYHPDVAGSGGEEQFIKIKTAHELLSNPHTIRDDVSLTHSSIFTVVKR